MRTTSAPGRVPPQAVGASDPVAPGEAAAPVPGSGWAPENGASRAFGLLLVVTGALGLLAAWVITLDKFTLLADPDFVPGCSLNPVVACGNIMKSEQAAAFGFPNPLLGLVTYPVVSCVGLGLLAGARFPRWYWLTFNAGTLFGVGFCTWLQFQSLYRISSLCLWCCLAWAATLLMFWYVTSYNVSRGFLPVPAGIRVVLTDFPWAAPVLHMGIIGMLILTRWWDFWTS
ncbi:vitamin K epoxide reductase family protein [Streptomyces kanamyceticus]|uniref:Vitamin K epoxide reductase family protein n=1 Tax=Streptomyces kanamyceticus TaxID=1967 RepID=A0A5J6GJM1_STRKN|nr:vitamin K epoxide reductase family protein [Streptomyces kanamyceticus]QEU94291.1 vitamin K epoxide reductase family protein [Streptomyces kanamyceticus]